MSNKATKPGPIPTKYITHLDKAKKKENIMNGSIGKPGVKTTEFWTALVPVLVGPVITFMVLLGIFDAGTNADELTSHINQAVQGLIAVVANIMSALACNKYVNARAATKNVQMQVDGTIQQKK